MGEGPSLKDEYNTLRAEMLALFDHIRKWEQGTIALYFAILAWFISNNFPGSIMCPILLGLITSSLSYFLSYYRDVYEKGTYISVFHEREEISPIRYISVNRQKYKPENRVCNNIDKSWGGMPKADAYVYLGLFALTVVLGGYQLFLKCEAKDKCLFGFNKNAISFDWPLWVMLFISVVISVFFFIVFSKIRRIQSWVRNQQKSMTSYRESSGLQGQT